MIPEKISWTQHSERGCDVDAVLYLDGAVVFFGRVTAHAAGVAAARAALHLHTRRPY